MIQQELDIHLSDFQDFDWEKAEAQADEEIRAGQITSFDTVEDFLADLKQ